MSTPSKHWLKLSLVFAAVGATLIGDVDTAGIHLQPPDAQAIIGRPFTPMSYAGVARRTVRRGTRRAAYVGAAAGYGYGYGYGYGAGYGYGSTMSYLPNNCVPVPGGAYRCGGVRYHAVYDGPSVVYTSY